MGSGRIITAPIITEDGNPIQDPIVLLEANKNGTAEDQNIFAGGRESSLRLENPNGIVNEPTVCAPLDKKVIQWKLTLHQIGKSNVNIPVLSVASVIYLLILPWH